MTRFEIFKLLHVIGAVVWVGAGAGLFLLTIRLRATGDRATILAIGRQTESLAKLLFMPAALGTLLFGILMVATEASFAFGDLWILIGLGGVAASFVVGVLMLEPADKQLTALASELGVDHPDVDLQLTKVIRLNDLFLTRPVGGSLDDSTVWLRRQFREHRRGDDQQQRQGNRATAGGGERR